MRASQPIATERKYADMFGRTWRRFKACKAHRHGSFHEYADKRASCAVWALSVVILVALVTSLIMGPVA